MSAIGCYGYCILELHVLLSTLYFCHAEFHISGNGGNILMIQISDNDFMVKGKHTVSS